VEHYGLAGWDCFGSEYEATGPASAARPDAGLGVGYGRTKGGIASAQRRNWGNLVSRSHIYSFRGFFPSDPVAEVLNILLTVEEHHPGMRAARLLGVEQSERLKAELAELGYLPLRGSTYPGVGYARPLSRMSGVGEIVLDSRGWQSSEDFYRAFFEAVGAPDWHGRNFDALHDSIGTGSINKVDVPYRIRLLNAGAMNGEAAKFVRKLAGLMDDLHADGCPVELILEQV
jgi:RNAse (barnase) inhibitor barstar